MIKRKRRTRNSSPPQQWTKLSHYVFQTYLNPTDIISIMFDELEPPPCYGETQRSPSERRGLDEEFEIDLALFREECEGIYVKRRSVLRETTSICPLLPNSGGNIATNNPLRGLNLGRVSNCKKRLKKRRTAPHILRDIKDISYKVRRLPKPVPCLGRCKKSKFRLAFSKKEEPMQIP